MLIEEAKVVTETPEEKTTANTVIHFKEKAAR